MHLKKWTLNNQMNSFIGFVCGLLLKDRLVKFGMKCVKHGLHQYYSMQKVIPNKKIITSIQLITKVRDHDYFKDLYNDNQDIHIYNFPPELVNYLDSNVHLLQLSIRDLCELNYRNNFEYPVLSKVGELYLYITYNLNGKEYINVYNQNDIIIGDSLLTENITPIVLCCTLNNEYITNHFKKFLNNDSLRTELVLMNIPDIKMNTLKVLYSNKCVEYSLTDQII